MRLGTTTMRAAAARARAPSRIARIAHHAMRPTTAARIAAAPRRPTASRAASYDDASVLRVGWFRARSETTDDACDARDGDEWREKYGK
jgi:hypothetical protein